MTTRKEIADAFIAAKELTARDRKECVFSSCRLNPGKHEFICHALDVLTTAQPGALAAKIVINNRFASSEIYGTSTIYAWLYEVAGVPDWQLTTDNVQAYKHRWLDSVIKEFSS